MSTDEKREGGSQRKSILKLPDRPMSKERRKSARWDEENIQDTLHPANKDYGFMKIDEPKTPYNWDAQSVDPNAPSTSGSRTAADGGVDARLLKEKLQQEINIDKEELNKKKAFEEKRKAHYDEFKALKAAKVFQTEDEEDEEKEDKKTNEEDKKTKEEKPGTAERKPVDSKARTDTKQSASASKTPSKEKGTKGAVAKDGKKTK